jgi:hypothetical protein
LIQHATELADLGIDLFEVGNLSAGEGRKQQCGCLVR